MPWRIRWERRALKDMAALSSRDRERISRFLLERVADRDDPRDIGAALAGPQSGYWRYRVGDYRVVANIVDAEVTVIVVRVGNRREVYR
jgi:mRNA interferase RelE/StbE